MILLISDGLRIGRADFGICLRVVQTRNVCAALVACTRWAPLPGMLTTRA